MSDKKSKSWEKLKAAHDRVELEDADSRMLDEGDPNANGVCMSEPALDYASRETLEAQLLAAEQKAQTNYEKALRAVAELENVRKRADREVSQARLYGQEKLLQSFLPVLDSLEQALMLITKETHGEVGEGVALTLQLFLSALEKHGVQEIAPEGLSFNPQEHEAIAVQPSAEVAPNTVLTVVQKGYKLNDRVMRAARVIVSKAAS